MIGIGSTRDGVPADLLRAPGGFAWWYVDVVTPEGDGVVLIWSYGLPFLPGYADGARRGRAELPGDRPSVNVVVYRRGAPVFYLLQEHPPEPVGSGDLGWEQRIGGSRFTRRVEGGRFTLEASLDCEVPGSRERLVGTVRVEGVARLPADADDGGEAAGPGDAHVWTPLSGPARAMVALEQGGRTVAQLSGRAYHDRNTGRVPLHALGIARWAWGRVPLADRERIYYLLWPETPPASSAAPLAMGVDVMADGRTRRVELAVDEGGRERRGIGGLRWPERVVLHAGGQPWMEVRHRRLADDGPFYLRLLSEAATREGERATGWSEIVHPGRVDLGAHRPFVRMRVHRVGGPNSIWLPLFTGAREGRAGRLFRQWLARG